MQEIKFSLAIDEINMVLEGLGNLPFARVYALVGKIQEQAAQQIKSDKAAHAQSSQASDSTPAAPQ